MEQKPDATEPAIFEQYEIKPWEFTPRIYKILAGSAILNLLIVAVFAQTNILTMKGCASPFVGRVCQVLDTVYIGAMLYGTERDYVDVAYERIDLGNADITFIDVSGQGPQLTYPEGYFQIANPEQYAALVAQADGLDSGFSPLGPTPPPATDLFKTTPRLPRSNRNIVRGAEPKSPFEIEGDEDETPTNNNTRRPGRGTTANANTGNNNADVAQANNNTQTEVVIPTGVDINRRPMVDLGNYVNELQQNNEINLQAEFVVDAQGRLDKDGRLDPKTFRYTVAKSPEENMVSVVQESIEALNVAGYLQYLKDLSGKDLRLQIRQDAENITGIVQSEMESDTRARSIKSAIDLAISIAKTQKTGPNATQNNKDELILLEGTKIETDGRRVIIRFSLPKGVAHPMIQRKLAEQAAEANKPSGNAEVRSDSSTAAR
ncbi:MAG: hypothetical protein H0V76_09790 [Blastocatellia bacterium]|nr:hypothetical protein [Blastocatellia bacterium]